MNPNENLVTVNPSGDYNTLNNLIELFRNNISSIDDVNIGEIHGEQFKIFKKAYDFSKRVHSGQTRTSGEPYLTHPIEVAAIVAGLRMDCASVAAALLHDTVEDTLTTIEDIREEFGGEVAFIVDGLTKLSRLSFKSSEELEAENIRKMIVAMAKDIRVIIIKLADRLHNMRTLDVLPRARQVRIAQETMDIYAPLANRLGIFLIKSELEDLSFKYLNQESYKDLSFKINKKKAERENYIAGVTGILKENLEKHHLRAEIYGRPKHFYSIFKKMIEQHVSFEDIYDLLALRIIVESETECYEALGIVHSIWKPIPGRIKDYIAMPKPNLYRSLHTTVIGPEGMRVEIQIRTKEMHFVDEFGIAAHWKYKENMPEDNRNDVQQFNWLRQLVEYQKELKDPQEFLDSVKIDLFQEEVYVFTPKGKVIALPKESTPVDFAYYIHTEVGDKASGAIVNGVMATLRQRLANGDIVEIITKEGRHPSKDWLKFAKSSKAISRIRNYIRQSEREESIVSGRDALEREFRRAEIEARKTQATIPDFRGMLEQSVQKLSLKGEDDLFAAIGYGKYTPAYIFSIVMPQKKKTDKLSLLTKTTGSVINKLLKKIKPSGGRNDAIVSPFGGHLLYKLGGCCRPIPGDPIVGFISRGRGVIVHKSDCKNMIGMDESRLVNVSWNENLAGSGGGGASSGSAAASGSFFGTKIRIITDDKKGILADIASVISAKGANISKAQVRTLNDGRAVHLFDVEVRDNKQADAIITGIQSVKGVLKVNRVA